MAAEYARRYGHDWTWFTTLVDPDAYDPQPPPPRRTTRLVYAGGLGRDRWRALQRLADTLARWTARDGPRTQISVYCPQRDATAHRRQLEGAGVRVHGWVPPDRLPSIFRDADLLLHVESSEGALVEYTRLSFSTKLSQYLMAGRCILVLGSERLESGRFLQRLGAGVAVEGTEAVAPCPARSWSPC